MPKKPHSKAVVKHSARAGNNHQPATGPSQPVASVSTHQRTYTIVDHRLENPTFSMRQVRDGDSVRYEITGNLTAPAPPIRDSKYLSKQQCIDIYRWMLLNRKMETALENLYKQGKVVGGVYFGLGQEGCSCASAYALKPDEWLGPMIRNQGSLLVRGFSPRDIMMQYMAKAGSPTRGRDASSHFGDIQTHNVVAPISTLGDLIPVLTGVALGARMQGREIAVMTYIGDGGQSTGVTYEGLNFAAVQKLGLVLFVENNLWGYSTPADMQFCVKDLAERAIAYGIPGVIVDGADVLGCYRASREAVDRARAGEGPTLIEAKVTRLTAHSSDDQQTKYRSAEELESEKGHDALPRFRGELRDAGILTDEIETAMNAEIATLVEDATEYAEHQPDPDPEFATRYVYAEEPEVAG